ncbi:MAG: hypothetical protein NTX49_09210 [Chlamydiae bacterium]|nr:hypothetical protein [Chlamydiota bacterium]
MTNPLFPISETKLPALFDGHRELIGRVPVNSPVVIKDILTPYFSIPTASRVHGYFQLHTKQNAPSRSWILDRFLSFCFHGVSKTMESFLYEAPPLDISGIIAPKVLQVPHLPYPAFVTQAAPRLFFTSTQPQLKDEYSPPCLLRETPPTTQEILSNEQEILAKTHYMKGALSIDRSGMIYLTLHGTDNQSLIRELVAKGTGTTISDFLEHPLGLHIPAFLPEETAKAKSLGILKELHGNFSFSARRVYSVDTPSHEGVEKSIYLHIESKQLMALREKYLLPARLNGNSFHMVLLLKKREKTAKPPLSTFRLNVSCYAA